MKKNDYDLIVQGAIFTNEEAAFLEAIKDPKKRKAIIRLLEEAERRGADSSSAYASSE